MQLIKAFHDVFQVGLCASLTAQHCRGCAAFNSLALPVCFVGFDCTAKVEVLADGQVRIAGLVLELGHLVRMNSQLKQEPFTVATRAVPCNQSP